MSRKIKSSSNPIVFSKTIGALFLPLVLMLMNCSGSSDPEPVDKPVSVFLPSNFPAPVYDLEANPVTEKGFALGKALFYDPVLSRDNTIACGSCHQQFAGFTHHGHDISHGIDSKLGTRNSLPVQNLIWSSGFFWDGGVQHLELTPVNAITNPVEMDESLDNIIEKLNNHETYRKKFKDVYGTDQINATQFLKALSQFMAMMVSANSRYDRYKRNEGYELTAQEVEGMMLFEEKCSACHATDLFTDNSFRNNGFSTNENLNRDSGREAITLNPDDRGKFKVPSLRNLAYTAPYMHNGKLKTIDDVLNFYDAGVNDTPTLDPELKQHEQPGIPMTNEEKEKIKAFLLTLTDEEFIYDKRFSEY